MTTVWVLSNKDEMEYENLRLLESFNNKGIDAILVNPNSFDIIVNRDKSSTIRYEGEKIDLPKVVLVRYGAGISKFILALIRQIEALGVVCINTADPIEKVKDKLQSSQILAHHGIAIPNTMMVRFPIDANVVEEEIGFPCVVKIVTGSYGDGVHLCETKRAFIKLMDFTQIVNSNKTFIVQEYLGDRPGEDLRVLVIGGRVVGAMKRTAPEGDFRANITNGGTGDQYEVTDEIDFIARETAKVLNLDIAGIDLLFDHCGFRVCEANSNPGFLGFEKYCGVDVADIITEYIRFRLT